eukprot:CAMPEP_0185030054 /NCGR_PEP_ID=MMETSP1103-20130426/16788_1 /TAXON_ID=36769 /ORGANISM="Paraphysomonas bandaiensis, Strain Caron Lab Isolate" /LENGTH=625 /DNA_ID=CAMNT_0027565023 /DNA_START=171 /DNA_END=2048 /DNA_ORIENTATION=-
METISQSPNIVIILVDDVGWNDFSYNTDSMSLISTPNIDKISSTGVRLKNQYVQATCTPTRASLLTGRYAANVGLIFAMVPGSPAGLPTDIPTMPQLLKEKGYDTIMVGKWHLGHSQWAQTPVGRGFDEHIGSYMWDLDSYTKQQYELPFEPLTVDWVHAYANGSYNHYAEPRHATEAITQDAIDVISKHGGKPNPLFLYVAYTAAHSPLQPLPRHEPPCAHIPHLWRRQFCGMVRGLDEGIYNLTEAMKQHLGENTILYVLSDNGGSTWFGGSNTPYRGGKSTPLEGGVKVPAFLVDYTSDQRYLGVRYALEEPVDGVNYVTQAHLIGREYHGLIHSADILPTIMGFAGAKDLSTSVDNLDGFDMGNALRSGTHDSPRKEMLLELYNADEFVFRNESMKSYRIGDLKLVEGIVRDPHMHYESVVDCINSSDSTQVTKYGEKALRALEWIFGSGPFDNTRIVITHRVVHLLLLRPQKTGLEPTLRLYNLSSDPTESHNIASENMAIVNTMRQRLMEIEKKRPYQQPFWMQYDLQTYWYKTFVSGDCSMNSRIPDRHCHFTHPWLPDDVDAWRDLPTLTNSVDYADRRGREVYIPVIICVAVLVALFLYVICGMLLKRKVEKKKRN